MKRKRIRMEGGFFLLLSGIILLVFLAGCVSSSDIRSDTVDRNNSTISVTDAYNNTVTFSHTVNRIVCLPGTAAETLVSIGAGDKVVGVSEMTYKDAYLMDQMPNAVSVGDYWIPDVEKIIALHPDLVISYGISQSKAGNIDKIRAANITVLYVKCYDIRDLADETRMLGRITGYDTLAEQVALFSERYIALIHERLENANPDESKKPRVYFERWTDYWTMGRDSPYQDLLTTLRANNVASDIPRVQSQVSPEWIIDQNPEVIFRLAVAGDNATIIRDMLMNRPGAESVRAVQDGRVYILYSDMVTSPRAAVGTLYIAKVLYPELFSDIDPVEVLRKYEEEFLPGTRSNNTFYPLLGKTGSETEKILSSSAGMRS